MPLNNVPLEHEWNILIRATDTRIFVTRPFQSLECKNIKVIWHRKETACLSLTHQKMYAYKISLKSKVFMSPAVWFQSEWSKQCGVTKTQSDHLLLQSNLNATILRCYNEYLIHVSQATYRLTMDQKKKIMQWNL